MIERTGYQGNILPSTLQSHQQIYGQMDHRDIIDQISNSSTGDIQLDDSIDDNTRLNLESFESPGRERASEIAEFASELRQTFQGLDDAAGELNMRDRPIGESAFDRRSVQISDAEVLVEEYIESRAERGEYQIEVRELAEGQLDRTEVLEGDAPVDEAIDVSTDEDYTFAIELTDDVDENTVEELFEIEIDEEGTVRDLLDRVAEEINSRGLGVEADVISNVEDEELNEGEIRLEIASRETGAREEFEVYDITESEDEEGLMEQLGLETVTEAQDAEVVADGVSEEDVHTRGDNLYLDDGRIQLELREVGETSVEVTGDTQEIRDRIENLVGVYDRALDFLEEREQGGELGTLRDRLVNIAVSAGSELSAIGVDVYTDGRMEIDDEALEQSIEDRIETVEDTIGGNRGVASRLERVAEETLRTPPSRYVEDIFEENDDTEGIEELMELDNYAMYDVFGRNQFPTSAGSGLLFDFYF
ncbi:flagellar filament capping protein FliD [Natranaerofaba carboxydovora]|uniref:flagellar filament capping protein FliD n=1 Tax=Natranaerofaba carboxydovora TaxID=2742683 RepID=UPI001F131FB1|nr:flagellar filament capping protein FliD [Natranaerofaba carboxydovora]UMZ74954.1 B-type flagellar hook-associated protein 2 [Natranaerofaba carboxydovora]